MVFRTRKGFVFFGPHCAFMFDGSYLAEGNPFSIPRCWALDVSGAATLAALIWAIVVVAS